MDEILRYLPLISILFSGGLGWFIWRLSDHFAAKTEVVTPLQLNEKLEQRLNDTFQRFKDAVVNDINTRVSSTGTENMLRYDSLDRNVSDIRETLREIRQKVEKTDVDAVEAKHQVELLGERMDGRSRLVDARLSVCEDKLERRQRDRET